MMKKMRPVKRYMRQVHRLVLETFKPIKNMNKLQVNHKDGNKSNNSLSNLEWVISSENLYHARNVLKHYRNQDGENNSMSKLTEEDVIKIIKECKYKNRRPDKLIAKDYHVSRKTISNICNNLTWKHIPRI